MPPLSSRAAVVAALLAAGAVVAPATPASATPAPLPTPAPATGRPAAPGPVTAPVAPPAQRWDAPAASVTAPAATVAAPALARGASRVRVVTTRVVAGSPRVVESEVPAARAVAAVDAAQDAPGAVAVAVDTPVHVSAYTDPLRPRRYDLTQLRGETFHARVRTSGVVVAVVDTGVDAGHEDLRGVVLPGAEFTDTAARGATGTRDAHGHGTHVAGIVAATANNARGAAGLAPGTRILPVRVMGDDGVGWSSDTTRGVYYAVSRGAKVVNLSLGGSRDPNLDKAIQYAASRGVVVVAAAGNERLEGNPVGYPAAYANVLAVGATDSARRAANFSSTGSYVDLAAPGVSILSTCPRALARSGYVAMSGTSMAAPQVSAVVAGLKAVRPTLTVAEATRVLRSTATDLGPKGQDRTYGAGLVDPVRALCSLTTCPASITWEAPTRSPVVGSRVAASAQVRTATGRVLARVPVRVCHRLAGETRSTCTTRTTDASGRAVAGFTARRVTDVAVAYAGGPLARAASSSARFATRPDLRAAGGPRRVDGTVAPRAATVDLQRYDARRRAYVLARRATTSATGAFAVRSLAPGTYRVGVPATPLLAGATSGSVVVR